MKRQRLLSLTILATLASCTSKPGVALQEDLGISLHTASQAAATHVRVVSDAHGQRVSGRLTTNYPDLPRNRRVTHVRPDGEEISVMAVRVPGTRRHKRSIRARFDVRLPE